MPERIPTRSTSGAAGYIEVPTQHEAAVAALLRERDGYLARGRQDRAAAVDAELVKLLPAGPVMTEPGCLHAECVLDHPHAGPAILKEEPTNASTRKRRTRQG